MKKKENNMFKHTMASVNIIKGELSLISYIVNIISSVFMLGYLIFATVMDRGILAVNITLLTLTAVNFVTYLITRKRNGSSSKKIKKFVKHFYNVSRIILNAIPLGTVLYLLAFTEEEISRIETVLLPLLILVWLAQVVLEISSIYIESRITLFVDGLKMDIEPIIKIKNAFSGESSRTVDLNVSDSNRAFLTDEAEKYIEAREKEEENVRKDGFVKRMTNTLGMIKDYIKK